MDEGMIFCEWCGRKLGTPTSWAERVRSHGYEWDARYCSINCEQKQADWRSRSTFETCLDNPLWDR